MLSYQIVNSKIFVLNYVRNYVTLDTGLMDILHLIKNIQMVNGIRFSGN